MNFIDQMVSKCAAAWVIGMHSLIKTLLYDGMHKLQVG